jgi:cell division protein FtsB
MNATEKITVRTGPEELREHRLIIATILLCLLMGFFGGLFAGIRSQEARIDALVTENTNLRLERDGLNARMRRIEPDIRLANEIIEGTKRRRTQR